MFIFLLLLILKKRPWGCEIVFVCLFVNLFGAVVCTPQSLIFKKQIFDEGFYAGIVFFQPDN